MYKPLMDGFYPELGRAVITFAGTPLNTFTADDVHKSLGKQRLDEQDLRILLSPAAEDFLEAMAQRAQGETLRHFGKSIHFFTPLYLANYCTNHCVYCGFSAKRGISRRMLSLEEVEKEAQSIAGSGLRRILALTGDSPKLTGAAYLADCLKILARYFSSVGIEVPSMTTEEYGSMVEAGADSMTMFQETYHEELYATLHPAGPKKDFAFRLDAPHRAALGGMRAVNLGALLGLDDWRRDMYMAALHADFLAHCFPQLEISMSFPRMRPCGDNADAPVTSAGSTEIADSQAEQKSQKNSFQPLPVTDQNLVQAILAFRCFMPQAGITLSTREPAWLRDRLIPLGITRISAGVSTAVGGHADDVLAGEEPQFDISDSRTVDEMALALEQKGYQPVFTDWLLPGEGTAPLGTGIHKALVQPQV